VFNSVAVELQPSAVVSKGKANKKALTDKESVKR